jgi:hypothetical protein
MDSSRSIRSNIFSFGIMRQPFHQAINDTGLNPISTPRRKLPAGNSNSEEKISPCYQSLHAPIVEKLTPCRGSE